MTDKIKMAFDGIAAEDSLKKHTLQKLQTRMQTRPKPRRYMNVRRLALVATCLVIVLLSGIYSHGLYFTEAAYIDLDINPSLEITLNRFNRVIAVEPYNADAEELLSDLDIKHKNVEAAIDAIIAAASQAGTLQREGLVSVTVQSVSGDGFQLLKNVQAGVSASVSHHGDAEVDVFPVDSDIRTAAHDLHISCAKYLAILKLQDVDPTATVEDCIDHTIGEIKQRTRAHSGNGHHGNGNSGIEDGGATDDDKDPSASPTCEPAQNTDDHNPGGKGKQNRHGHDS